MPMDVQMRGTRAQSPQSQLIRALTSTLEAVADRLDRIEGKVNALASQALARELEVREEALAKMLDLLSRARDEMVIRMDTTPVSLILGRVRDALSNLPSDPADRAREVLRLEGMLDAARLMMEDRAVTDKLVILRKRGYTDTLLRSSTSKRKSRLLEEWEELRGRAQEVVEHLDNFSRVYSPHMMLPLKGRLSSLMEEGERARGEGDLGRLREITAALREATDLVENVVLSNREVLKRLRIDS